MYLNNLNMNYILPICDPSPQINIYTFIQQINCKCLLFITQYQLQILAIYTKNSHSNSCFLVIVYTIFRFIIHSVYEVIRVKNQPLFIRILNPFSPEKDRARFQKKGTPDGITYPIHSYSAIPSPAPFL